MSGYSFKKAAIYSTLGIAFGAAVAVKRAYDHLNNESFDTLSAAFMHVAPPEMMATTIAISLTIGAAIEGISWYNRKLDQETRTQYGQRTKPPSHK